MDACSCGHGLTVHVGYTGGCGLCDSCAGFQADTKPLRPGDEGWVPDDREVKFVVRMADALQHQRDELAEKVEELWMSEDWQFFDDEERLASVLWAIQHDDDPPAPVPRESK